MNLKLLKVFCAVVDAGSASAAAGRLHIAATAISMQMAQLEASVGGKLFDRSKRPMGLTTLGAFLYPKAKELLSNAAQIQVEAQGIATGNLGWLSIGFVRSTIFSVLPSAVREMRSRFPDVRIDLVEILSEHQAQSIRSGTIHIGISRQIGDFGKERDMAYTSLLNDPLVAAIPVHHPLAGRKHLQPKDLDSLPFICFPKDPYSTFSRQSLDYLRSHGGAPVVGYEAKEIHTALGLVAAGLGATLVGKTVSVNNRSDVKFIPFKGKQMDTQIFALVSQSDAHPVVQRFLKILVDCADTLS
jgi:LysR family transcriptional regulator, benzoate and cis,cis-muconate-responsive activator of ben and cat genes